MIALTSDDENFLIKNFPRKWKIVGDNYLIISNYPLPQGYVQDTTDLMILIPPNYPADTLDMFYLDPHIERKDGLPLGALATESHCDRDWQRWSRHHNWQSGVHGLAYHFQLIGNILASEAK